MLILILSIRNGSVRFHVAREIWDFRHGVVETLAFLGCYVVYVAALPPQKSEGFFPP